MQIEKKQYSGLVADLMPNIRLMQALGCFLHRFSDGSPFLNKLYSFMHLTFLFLQYIALIINLAMNTSEVNELTANTITVLHFTHTITKFSYLALSSKSFYR